MRTVVVGIADMAVSNDPDVVLATYALGSCIGLLVHDPLAKVGGLLHFLLPSSKIDERRAKENPCLYGDLAVPMLLREIQKLGAERSRLTAFLAGGSRILDPNGLFEIGKRNHVTARNLLWKAGVLIKREAVGGMEMRSVTLEVATGRVALKEQPATSADLAGAAQSKGGDLGLSYSRRG